VQRYLLDFRSQFHRKGLWFQPISFAKDLFPLKYFWKQNGSVPHSSLKKFFSVLFNLWIYFARKCKLKATDCISTKPNFIILLCLFIKLKSWDSPDCPSHSSPLTWHSVTFSDSATWRKNDKGWISNRKIGWSLRWQRFSANFRFGRHQEYSTNGSRDYTGVIQMVESISK
jgi:hypothetical protein